MTDPDANTELPTDVLVVGAGPAGLYAAFYVALRGLTVRLVEARPEPGGQLTALYPEKHVYDAPGHPAIRAADLVERLVAQLAAFDPDLRFGELATGLSRDGDSWVLRTSRAAHRARAVIVTAGIGALVPREARLDLPTGGPVVLTELPRPGDWTGRAVLVHGGVPQAVRAALELHDAGARVTLAHRRAGFRGTPQQLARLDALKRSGQVLVVAPAELVAVDSGGVHLATGPDDLVQHAADAVYVAGGYLPDLTPLASWNLDWNGEYVVAGHGQRTNLDGVFVAGDLSTGGGEFKLIAGAFAQAAVAANHAVHHARPDLKVRPGHSSDRRLPTRSAST